MPTPWVYRTLNSQRFFSIAAGLSVFSWAIIGFVQAIQRDELAPARVVITILNATVACLFLCRSDAIRNATAQTIAMCVPAIALSGWALLVTAPMTEWPLHANVVFAIAGGCAVFSFLCLGRSFAILPAIRQVVTRGPYRLVRHPAYLSEWIMMIACFLASPSWITIAPAAVALPLIAMRIVAEESLLRRSTAYCAFTETVRWRLVPLVW